MSILATLKGYFGDKKVRGAHFPQGSIWSRFFTYTSRTAINYEQEVKDPMLNTIVASCIGWMVDAWPEAPPQIVNISDDGEEKPAKHGALDILKTPNPWYGDRQLWSATLTDLKIDGNAYWHVIKDNRGQPLAVYWLPCGTVEPKWNHNDQSKFITHYEYTPDGVAVNIPTDEMVHFREGFDPGNIRKGRARFKACLSEVYGDNEASLYVATMLRNMGMAGVILSPKPNDTGAGLEPDDAQAIADNYKWKTQGDKRGEAIMINVPMDVHELGSALDKIQTRELRRIPEERICAVLKIPPGVAKLGAGLDRNTFANAETEQAQAWRNCIIPLHGQIADVLDQQFLPLWGDPKGVTVRFDVSQVNALQEDENDKVVRVNTLWTSDIITREEARNELGKPVDTARDNIFRSRWMVTAMQDMGVEPMAPEDDSEPEPGKSFKALHPDLDAAVEKYRKRLLMLEAEAVQSILTVYKLAERQLLKDLKRLEKRMGEAIAAGEEISEAWLLKEERYRALLKQIDVQMDRLSGHASTVVDDTQRIVGYMALESSAAVAASVGVDAAWNRLPIRAVEQFIGYASDGSPLKAIFDELGPDMSKNVRDTIASGIAQGKNPNVVAAEIRGAFEKTLHRAETITRTEMLRTYREVTRESYNANGLNKWAWLSAADSRTCSACWAMHGQTFSTQEKLDGHPQCRCTMVPIVKNGVVIDDGSTVFASLSEADQREILGEGGYEMYRNGQAELRDFVVQTSDPRWGTMRRAATQQEAVSNARLRG